MVLPLSLIRSTVSGPILVELKSGETYSGTLVACDNWMNLHLKDVVLTTKSGDAFWKLPEVYLRGNHVKYLRMPDEVLDVVKDQALKAADQRMVSRGGRGGATRGGRRDGELGDRVADSRDSRGGKQQGQRSGRRY